MLLDGHHLERSGGVITTTAMTILNLCDAFGEMDSLSTAPPESPTPGDEWYHG